MATVTEIDHGALPRPHACFLLERAFPIVLPRGLDARDLWVALSYRVMREPTDLLAHSRRVVVCHDRRLASRLPGALHDLHHVANGRGRALRARLLAAARGRLAPAYVVHFERALDEPTLAPPMPFEGSVLPTMAQLLAAAPRHHGDAPSRAS